MKQNQGPPATESAAQPPGSVWNVPNLLCLIRLLGSTVLPALGYYQAEWPFLVLLVFLFFTDWLDGKLAILLNQRTELGARLDSAADAAMWMGLLLGGWWLREDVLRQELPWLLAAAASFGVSAAVGLWKFGRVPSYHTWAAKSSWLLTAVSVALMFGGGPVWPLRVAMTAVILTNLEATGITLAIPRWRVDIRSLYHALRDNRTGPANQA